MTHGANLAGVIERAAIRRIVAVLRTRREACGLSTRVLGGQIGTPYQQIGKWERGEVVPSLSSLIRWARALDSRIEVEP